MRIAGWHIDGFGHLCDLEAHDVAAGLVVLHGPNEAGKSTLVDFLGGMLFGFPRGNTRSVKRPPTRGGNHGGRLWLDDDGDVLLLDRKLRQLTVRRASDDASLSETEYRNLVGGASRQLFDAVFSVDLDDLHSLDALSDDELNDLVFSAGVVGAGRSATAAIELLGTRRQNLYRPRGRAENYPVLGLRDQLRDAQDRLAHARRSAAGVATQRRSLAMAEEQTTELRCEASELDSRRRRLRLLLELWPAWIESCEAERRRTELPEGPTVEPTSATRLIGLESTLDAARAEEREAQAAADQVRLRSEALNVDDVALAVVEPVAALRHRQALVDRWREEGHELGLRAAASQRQAETLLTDLGPGEGSRLLADVPLDIPTAAAMANAAETLRTATDAERSARASVMQVAEDLATGRARLAARVGTLEAGGSADIASADERVATLSSLLSASGAPGAGDSDHAEPRPGLVIGSVLSMLVVGGVLYLAGWAVPAAVSVLAAVALLVVGLVGGGLRVVSSKASGPRSDVPLVRGRSSDLEAAAHGLGLASAERGCVEAALETARRERDEAFLRSANLASVAHDAAEMEAVGTARIAAAEQRLHQARTELAAAHASWTGWLAQNHLPSDLAVGGATALVENLRQSRSALDQAARFREAAAERQGDIHNFDAAVTEIADRLGVRRGEHGGATLEAVSARVAVATEEAAVRRDAQQLAATRAAALAAVGRRVAAAGRARDLLLIEAGVATTEELRSAAAFTARRVELGAVVEGFDRSLRLASGEGRAQELRSELLVGDPSGWESELQDVAATLAVVEERRDHVVDDSGELRRQLASAEQSADVAALTLEVEGLRAELRAAVREWMVLGLAQGLMSETLARYQRERQPRVLARAQELFELITDGGYPQLRTENRVVSAVDRTGRAVEAGHLSRGTMEQLYLCLRFALAESFAERASLPILLDDVLVNFDPGRAARVAAVVAAVAEHHQVLAFTCHPWVRDVLVSAASTCSEIPLDCTTGALVPRHHGPTAPPQRESA